MRTMTGHLRIGRWIAEDWHCIWIKNRMEKHEAERYIKKFSL